MNNINIDSLELLKDQIESLENHIDNAVEWSQNNSDLNMDRDDIILLKENRMNINRIKKSILSKPVFALFGPSQVGKSYLVKNLLSLDGNPLEIIIGDKSYDFLEKINPAGSGAESTGVVTRFTINNKINADNSLVKAKLISISDLIIILTDCYINDTDISEPKYDNFENHIKKLESEYLSKENIQEHLNENNIFEIKDYFNTNIKKSYLKQVLNSSNYWSRIGNIINKIPSKKWIDVFKLYWNDNPEINNLFKLLNDNLSELGYEESVYLEGSAILRNEGGILDVTRVKEIYDENKSKQKVYSKDKDVSINTNILSALISEITLCVSEDLKNHKEFINNTDLLDFPGARSRQELKKITNVETPLMFLRGKIAFLFKKYSSNLAINNLLFCIKDEQIDVVELASILNEWINTNIGDSIENRSNAISNLNTNPLFIIFTFFNKQLKFDSTNDEMDLNYKWENRFNRFFQQEIVSSSYNWDTNWTSNNQLFKNFFLLRDFKYSTDTFLGYDTDGVEKTINPLREEYLTRLKDSFVKFPFVKNHFANSEESWDGAATVNSDGTKLMIDKLSPSANNIVKTNNSIKRCDVIKTKTLECLDKYYISENKEEERNKIKKSCLNISLGLSKYIGNEPQKFTSFIKSLQLSESEIYNVFHENINKESNVANFSSKQLISNLYPYLSDTNSLEENIEIIRVQEGLEKKEDVIEILTSNDIDLKQFKQVNFENELNIIINKILKIWENKVKTNPCEIDEEILNQIISDLNKMIEADKLAQNIHDELSPKFNRVKINREDEVYFATITTNLINEFINNFGTNNYDSTISTKLKEILSTKEVELYTKIDKDAPDLNTEKLNEIFKDNFLDKKNNFHNYMQNFEEWKLRMKISLLNNCGFVSNEKNNKKIKELINSINKVNPIV